MKKHTINWLYYLQWKQLATALLIVLISCGASDSPSMTAPSAVVSTATSTVAPTQTDLALSAQSAAAIQMSSPAASAIRVGGQLPLNQPWIFVPYLNYDKQAKNLFAIGSDGTISALHWQVIAIAERSQEPPLLFISTPDRLVEVFDPLSKRRTRLDLPADAIIQRTLISPDGNKIAFFASFNPPINGVKGAPADGLRIVNLYSGKIEWLRFEAFEPFLADIPGPIAWGETGLYIHAQGSATSVFWRINPDNLVEPPQKIADIGHTGNWSIDRRGSFLIHKDSYGGPHMLDLRSGTDQTIEGDGHLLAPEGSMLAYTQPDTHGSCCELVLSDPQMSKATVLTTLKEPQSFTGYYSYLWTRKTQNLLVFTQHSAYVEGEEASSVEGEVLLFDVNQKQLGRVRLPEEAGSLRLTNDDQILYTAMQGEQAFLKALPLHKDKRPSYPKIILPFQGQSGQIVYVP